VPVADAETTVAFNTEEAESRMLDGVAVTVVVVAVSTAALAAAMKFATSSEPTPVTSS
jgi:hypothetical protein